MSKELITKETMETVVNGAKSIGEVVAGVSTELMNEAINLFIVESVLSILKYAAVFVVFMVVKKYYDVLIESSDKDKTSVAKGFKTASLVASIIFFTAMSFPHITQISKALVAPKIFLLEKAKTLVGK